MLPLAWIWYGALPLGPVRSVLQAAPLPAVAAICKLTEFDVKLAQTLRRCAIAAFCA